MSAGPPRSEEPRHDRGFSFGDAAGHAGPRHRAGSELYLGIVLGALYVAAILVMRRRPVLFTDELDHYSQIALFLRGDFRVLTYYLTTIPGYHAAVAAILWLCGATSLDAARLANAGFGLAAAAGFHALRRQLWPGTETLATAQFLVLPILVPLFFIVYTDVLALALVVWAAWATWTQRRWLSALLLSALICVRQNEVVWAGFLAMLAVWPAWTAGRWHAWRTILARGLPYLVPVAGFLAFWRWNGSISLSPRQSALHPDLSLHAGNLFFAVFVAGALLPLHVVAGLREFGAALRRQPWLLAVPILIFTAFWYGFHVDNPYNTVSPGYYVRNGLLLAADADPAVRMAGGAGVAIAACGLAFTRLRPAWAAWLYPFAVVFLAASWLIEQRYLLVPLVLWLAFRQQRRRAIEWATLALWLVLAVWVFLGVANGRFFL